MNDKQFDIITVGSATRDVFLKTGDFEMRKHADSPTGLEECLPLGAKIEIKEIAFTTGGGGTNSAVTFARQGFDTACVGVVGDDSAGDEIIKELKSEGVNVDYMSRHGDDITAYSTILVHQSGERTILSYKGEGQHFELKKIPIKKFKAQWFFLDSLGGHYDLLDALVRHAVENGIKIALNPGERELEHGREKLGAIMKHADIFIANKEEGAKLVGMAIADGQKILKELQLMTDGMVVLTDGPRGALVGVGGKIYAAGVPVSPVIERTGAGDAFGSGFVSQLVRTGDVVKAIQFGTANASSVVTKFGSKAGILKKGDWGQWPLIDVNEI